MTDILISIWRQRTTLLPKYVSSNVMTLQSMLYVIGQCTWSTGRSKEWWKVSVPVHGHVNIRVVSKLADWVQPHIYLYRFWLKLKLLLCWFVTLLRRWHYSQACWHLCFGLTCLAEESFEDQQGVTTVGYTWEISRLTSAPKTLRTCFINTEWFGISIWKTEEADHRLPSWNSRTRGELQSHVLTSSPLFQLKVKLFWADKTVNIGVDDRWIIFLNSWQHPKQSEVFFMLLPIYNTWITIGKHFC